MTISALIIIIIITIAVSMNAMNNDELKNKLMFSPYRCKHDKESYRFLSHTLIHADFQHLAFNMFTLYFMGKQLEVSFQIHYQSFVMGEVYFVGLYILGGLFATLIPFIRNQDNPGYRSLGASGAVSAIVFASIIWNPLGGLLVMGFPMPAWVFGILYLALEIWLDKKGNTGVAHDAHIGGAIFGVVFILITNIEKGKEILDLVF